MKEYSYSIKMDCNNESIGKVKSTSRYLAAVWFSNIKQLPLKQFLQIYKVSK